MKSSLCRCAAVAVDERKLSRSGAVLVPGAAPPGSSCKLVGRWTISESAEHVSETKLFKLAGFLRDQTKTKSIMPAIFCSQCAHQSSSDVSLDETSRRRPSVDHELDELFSMFSTVVKVSPTMKPGSHPRKNLELPAPARFCRRQRAINADHPASIVVPGIAR